MLAVAAMSHDRQLTDTLQNIVLQELAKRTTDANWVHLYEHSTQNAVFLIVKKLKAFLNFIIIPWGCSVRLSLRPFPSWLQN